MFIYKVKTTKVNFRVYKQCSQATTRLICEESFLCKMLVSLFSSNIPLNIGKNPVEKLCDVLEMELKMYIAVGLKFVFKKIKFKAFHYILRDFLRQRPGFSKDYTSIFKRI